MQRVVDGCEEEHHHERNRYVHGRGEGAEHAGYGPDHGRLAHPADQRPASKMLLLIRARLQAAAFTSTMLQSMVAALRDDQTCNSGHYCVTRQKCVSSPVVDAEWRVAAASALCCVYLPGFGVRVSNIRRRECIVRGALGRAGVVLRRADVEMVLMVRPAV